MPRKPTGRPTGRPVGSGHLDAPRRITVWLPGDIYEKLTIFAEGRRGTRGGHPQLARCVRDAITHYLFCPDKRQTRNVPQVPVEPLTPVQVDDATKKATLEAVQATINERLKQLPYRRVKAKKSPV